MSCCPAAATPDRSSSCFFPNELLAGKVPQAPRSPQHVLRLRKVLSAGDTLSAE
ncbi:hypothetical protein PHLGIDRAFT_208419 [Phlebiopsis gigantea 11061_1 CR5-6]|uniref:Uncharacterized protein n=1 Tax=Phlebiopsis gigantea (strain 11061_1 CR5-6) TaxID=745531 RepID=A0A0C3S4G8_PHLG1|nr:hypothetical protein PHLGIDRAFT_208419 [Phlebiopsis gigantea 11061_1 CR5-6]